MCFLKYPCSHQCSTDQSLQYCYFRSHWKRVKELVLCNRSYFRSYNNAWSCSMILHSRFSCTLYHNQDKWSLYIDVQSYYWLRVGKECSCLCCGSWTVELCIKQASTQCAYIVVHILMYKMYLFLSTPKKWHMKEDVGKISMWDFS